MNVHDRRLQDPSTRRKFRNVRERVLERWGGQAAKRFDRLFRRGSAVLEAYEALRTQHKGARL